MVICNRDRSEGLKGICVTEAIHLGDSQRNDFSGVYGGQLRLDYGFVDSRDIICAGLKH